MTGSLHFSLVPSEIVDSETKKKKKWKKKKKEVKSVAEDDFTVNTSDDRFSALFSRSEFNIDPTDPNFKKTKNMEKIIEEKLKRIEEGVKPSENKQEEKKRKLDPEISKSLKSVKNKWKKNAKKSKFSAK